MAKCDLDEKAEEILKNAESLGVENGYMFVTSFQRYIELLDHLRQLRTAIEADGTIVTKEYVKGRQNMYVNPAVTAYNQTAGAADKTAATLLKYLECKREGKKGGDAFDNF